MKEYHLLHDKIEFRYLIFNLLILFFCNISTAEETGDSIIEKVKGGIYYNGEVNKKQFFIRIDKTAQNGEFFFVTDKSLTTLERFNYRFIGNKLIVDYADKIHTIQMSGNISGESFIGAVSMKKKLLGLIPWFKKAYIFTLKPFNNPYQTLITGRYYQPVFNEVNVGKDVVYGRAVGYRTSVDCENPPKFLENLPSLITKKLDLKMDIYSPKGDTVKLRPLVLLIHGGGFFMGNKECKTNVDLSNILASRGFVVAAIDYRIGFQPTKPSIKRSGYRAIQDGRAALRFLSQFKDKYGIDPMNVILIGTSAGAITSLNIAFLDEDERPDESKGSFLIDDEGCIDCTGNDYKTSFKIRLVVNMWGAVHDLGIIDEDNRVPVLSIHGDQDTTVPYENDFPFKDYKGYKLLVDKMFGSRLIDEVLRNENVKSELITFKGFNHEPHITNGQFNENYEVIKTSIRDFLYGEFTDELNLDIKELSITGDEENRNFSVGNVKNGLGLVWNALGGFVIEQDNRHAKTVWFNNIPGHQLEVMLTDKYRFVSNPLVISLAAQK